MTGTVTSRRWFISAMGLVICSRLISLLIYPVPDFPDTAGYIEYALKILNDPHLWGELDTNGFSVTAARTIGYPFTLALTLGLFDGLGPKIMQALQSVVFILASWLTFRTSEAFLKSSALAFVVVSCTALSYGLTFDLALLPDGFVKSAWIIVAALSIQLAMRQGLKPKYSICLISFFILCMVTLRGNGLHLAIMLSPLIVFSISRHVEAGWKRLMVLGLVIAPALLFQFMISAWNENRSGEFFYSAGGALAIMQPIARMQAQHPQILDGKSDLSSLMNELNPQGEYQPLYDVVSAMNTRYGHSIYQTQMAAASLYLHTVPQYPSIFLRMFLRNFDTKFAIGLANPALGLNEAHFLLTDKRIFNGFSKLIKIKKSGPEWVYVIFYALFGILSVGLMSLFLIATPILCLACSISKREISESISLRNRIAGLLWVSVVAVLGYYCALFMELRFVSQLQPFTLILSLFCIAELYRRRCEG